jgi:hypothetical protein
MLSQETIYRDLKDRLTLIAKDVQVPSASEWKAIYSQYLGFLYSVLGLVDFRDGT